MSAAPGAYLERRWLAATAGTGHDRRNWPRPPELAVLKAAEGSWRQGRRCAWL